MYLNLFIVNRLIKPGWYDEDECERIGHYEPEPEREGSFGEFNVFRGKRVGVKRGDY